MIDKKVLSYTNPSNMPKEDILKLELKYQNVIHFIYEFIRGYYEPHYAKLTTDDRMSLYKNECFWNEIGDQIHLIYTDYNPYINKLPLLYDFLDDFYQYIKPEDLATIADTDDLISITILQYVYGEID